MNCCRLISGLVMGAEEIVARDVQVGEGGQTTVKKYSISERKKLNIIAQLNQIRDCV